MKIETYIITAHVFYNDKEEDSYGPAHAVFDFLLKNKKHVFFIKHSLNNNIPTKIIDYNNITKFYPRKNKNIISKSIEEYKFNISQTIKLGKKQKIIYIGADPVNSLSGAILKYLNKITTNIYFVCDYADKRFANFIFNGIYHLVDRICLKRADNVWCVSSRIVKKRINQKIDIKKIKLLPNSPDLKTIPAKPKTNKKNLIIVSNLTKSLNLMPILQTLFKLLKIEPKIKLQIIGSGPDKIYFQKMVEDLDLNDSVIFLGQKNHTEVLREISKSFLGFALYTQNNSWNLYGDSMKAREYVACGVPVIINNVPSTADDIQKYDAGLVIEKNINAEKVYEFIKKCLNNKKYYKALEHNAYKLAKDFDKDKLLNQLFGIIS